MQETLSKAWGPHPPGTIVTDTREEVTQGSGGVARVVRVNGARLQKLRQQGYLKSPASPAPRTPEGGGEED